MGVAVQLADLLLWVVDVVQVHEEEQKQKINALDERAEGKYASPGNKAGSKTGAKSPAPNSEAKPGARDSAAQGKAGYDDSEGGSKGLSEGLRQLAVENQQPGPASAGKGGSAGSAGSGSVVATAQHGAIDYTVEAVERPGEDRDGPSPLWRVRFAVPREL